MGSDARMKLVRMFNDQGRPYPSYSVLYQLFELSGLPCIDQTEINSQSDEVYVLPMINGNSLEWARGERKCKFYVFQIERWLTTAEDFAPAGFDRMFIADRWQAQALADRPYVRYMPIGGHPGLGGPPAEKKWDLAVMAYIYGRRQALLNQIQGQGYSIAPNAFCPERDNILAESRCGLSLHQHDNDPSLNPLRAVLFACWKLPLIFEYVKDPHPFLAYSLSEVPEAMRDMRGYAEQNYKLVTEDFEFRKVLEAACAD